MKVSSLKQVIDVATLETVKNLQILENTLFLSKPTYYRLVARFKSLSAVFQIAINNHIEFSGEELLIRNFLYHFYHDIYNTYEFPFSDEIKQTSKLMVKSLMEIEMLEIGNIREVNQTRLIYWLSLMQIRTSNGHYLEKTFEVLPPEKIEAIYQVLKQHLYASKSSLMQEAREILIWLAAEVRETHLEYIFSPEHNVLNLTNSFMKIAQEHFPNYIEEFEHPDFQKALNRIHLRLARYNRTRYDFNEFSFMSSYNQTFLTADEIAKSIVEKMEDDSNNRRLIKYRAQGLTLEYCFLILNRISFEKLIPVRKIKVDFTYGINFNHFLTQVIKGMALSNLKIIDIYSDEIPDIYLSDTPLDNSLPNQIQVLWRAYPSAKEWDDLEKLIIENQNESSSLLLDD
jgi:hypothetical protein